MYTPLPGYTGIDQFSYTVRDAEGRVSPEARVGITVTAGGPATATVGATSPADGADDPRTDARSPPRSSRRPARRSPSGPCRTGDPASSTLVPLATGTGTAVAADFDPTLVRNGTYAIVIRAVTSGGGVLVNETGVSVEGEYKPGRYTTTFRDVAVNSANIPIELFRTYDSTNKAAGELGAGWSLELANFRVESNGPLGGGGWTDVHVRQRSRSSPPATSRRKPHFVTVTWPDGHVERFRFTPNQGSQLVPTITTAGFIAEPGTTSTLEPVGNGLLLSGVGLPARRLLQRRRHLRPDPVRAHRQVRHEVPPRPARRTARRSPTATATPSASAATASTRRPGIVDDVRPRRRRTGSRAIVGPSGNIDYTLRRRPATSSASTTRTARTQTFTYDADHNLLTVERRRPARAHRCTTTTPVG